MLLPLDLELLQLEGPFQLMGLLELTAVSERLADKQAAVGRLVVVLADRLVAEGKWAAARRLAAAGMWVGAPVGKRVECLQVDCKPVGRKLAELAGCRPAGFHLDSCKQVAEVFARPVDHCLGLAVLVDFELGLDP